MFLKKVLQCEQWAIYVDRRYLPYNTLQYGLLVTDSYLFVKGNPIR